MSFICSMARPFGRWARIVAGIALVLAGPLAINGVAGIAVGVVGVVVVLAGAVNFCLLAPIFRAPFGGHSALAGQR